LSIYPPVRDELTRLLSRPRLTKYKQAVPGGKLSDALQLYVWNLAISGAFYESLHYFEVGLRNTMDEALTKWATHTLGATNPWYRDPAVPLDSESRKHVRLATKRATDDGKRSELHGGVVAELTFGFWWSLLSDHYNRTLWQPCLQHAFINARRRRPHDELDHLRELRNRIAHHEPIHGRDLANDYTTMLDTAERFRRGWPGGSTTQAGCLSY
jgi:hypothetical protein